MSFILAVNCGSFTMKAQLVHADTREIVAKILCQRIGSAESFIEITVGNEPRRTIEIVLDNHADAFAESMKLLVDVADTADIIAVGHRVVHGGDKFASSVKITDDVMDTLRELIPLAPMHNPANIIGIEASKSVLPHAAQVAVFDTAFHQTMPDFAFRYAVPNSWYTDLGVRKYGFHGTSHLYVSKRAAAMIGKDARELNAITMHIGGGASACAIRDGISIDTSMGLTPLPGLMMGTRPGDLDAAIPFYVKERLGLTDSEILTALNKKSGLIGLTEIYDDQRDVMCNLDNPNCRLAFNMRVYGLQKQIGMYLAALGAKCDALVWTAGVGENNPVVRAAVMDGLTQFGIKIDAAANNATECFKGAPARIISTPDSAITVIAIPTNEELVLVEDTIAICTGTFNPNHLEMNYSFVK